VHLNRKIVLHGQGIGNQDSKKESKSEKQKQKQNELGKEQTL